MPVVLTTGYSETAVGMENGEFEIILKPYSLESLLLALRAQIGSQYA
jgi:DNA-binding response OmpR family regulator